MRLTTRGRYVTTILVVVAVCAVIVALNYALGLDRVPSDCP